MFSLNNTTTVQYDGDNRQTVTTDPLSRTNTVLYDKASEVTQTVDGNGNSSYFLYDHAGRQISAKDQDGNTTFTAYDSSDNPIKSTDANSNISYTAYDGDSRAVMATPPSSSGLAASSTSYDGNGNVASQSDHGIITRYQYDADNEQVAQFDALGHKSTMSYGPLGQVLTATDANYNTTYYGYDADGRQTSSVLASTAKTTTQYDAAGNVIATTDPDGNITHFLLNADGSVVATMDPLGALAYTGYDADNRAVTKVDRNGKTITDTYDAAGQLTSEQLTDANGYQSDNLAYTYDNNGQVTRAQNTVGSYTMTLDPAGRLTQETDPNGLTVSYGYDPNGNITSQSDTAGATVTSVYDSANRLQSRSFSETSPSASLREELTYNPQDEITTEKRYNAASGGTLVGQTVQGFDGVGNITSIIHKNGNGNTLESFTYSYDPGNRLSSETDTVIGTTTKNYTYDGSNQLTSAGGTTYNYDLAGNRNSAQYQIDAGNQYDTDGNWNYIYDAAGNLVEKDGVAGTQYAGLVWKYGYDGFERLSSATETNNGTQVDQENISYDVFGNRVEEDVTKNGTTTVTKQAYDANGVCYADISSAGSIVTRRVNLDAVDALFARIGQTGTIAWYLTDHLGSVTGLMNNGGSLIDGLVYDAYGNVTNETSPSNGDRYAFTGRERDMETGLQYNRARWYDPSTGRWITQDPLGFDAGDSNLYRYVNNGPTGGTDPSGTELFVAGNDAKNRLLDVLTQYGIPFSGAKKLPGEYGGYVPNGDNVAGADNLFQIVSTAKFSDEIVKNIKAKAGNNDALANGILNLSALSEEI